MSTPPVIAIGLDALERRVMDEWMAAGHLPNLQRLHDEGVRADLACHPVNTAELPWFQFIGGQEVENLPLVSELEYNPETLDVRNIRAPDPTVLKPWYGGVTGARMALFDVPKARVVDTVDGIQVVAWGAHAPAAFSAASPQAYLDHVLATWGPHPTLEKDIIHAWQSGNLRWLHRTLRKAVETRTDILLDLIARERWDLVMMVYGECHGGGHAFWHIGQTDHPLHGVLGWHNDDDPLLQIYQDVDVAVGRIRAAAPEARILFFSPHGMEASNKEVPSNCFLPELLYRMQFGNEAFQNLQGEIPALKDIVVSEPWARVVWGTATETPGSNRLASRFKLDRFTTGLGLTAPRPVSPREAVKFSWAPSYWYRGCWSRMAAFALPSFAEGWVRLNVAGRDQGGVVAESDFLATCDRVTAEIRELRNPRTGNPAVLDVHRTRETPHDPRAKSTDADLVVTWSPEPADIMEHPTYGRFGPVPFCRTGAHSSRGWLCATGPGIRSGRIEDSRSVNIPATILAAMETTTSAQIDGQALPIFA